jgi:hypothetical protein
VSGSTAPVAANSGTGRAGLTAAQLFGRSAELSVLQEAWRAAVAGGRGLVLARGDAGVGKTRLVAEVAEMARLQGAVVANAQCFGTAGRLALAPVADWLRNDAVQSAVATLAPVWRTEVGRLAPAEGHGTSSRATADAWQRHRFFEGLARALTAVHRPLLLVLDNVQWCDQERLAFITFCLGLAGVWWLPEVMRMRAAYDEEQAAIPRLRSAARMASEHGSVALLRRCERDLSTRGVRLIPPSVPPTE